MKKFRADEMRFIKKASTAKLVRFEKDGNLPKR
jgi:hypothetical protein